MILPMAGLLFILSLLCGLGTLALMLLYAFRRRLRTNRALTMPVLFGVIGCAIALVFSAIALARKNDSAFNAVPFWPGSTMLMAGHGDSLSTTALLFGLAILSGIGSYGALGLFVGLVWNWIGPEKTISSKGEL